MFLPRGRAGERTKNKVRIAGSSGRVATLKTDGTTGFSFLPRRLSCSVLTLRHVGLDSSRLLTSLDVCAVAVMERLPILE